MIFDMHVHLAEIGRDPRTDRFLRRPNFAVRMFFRQLKLPPGTLTAPDANAQIQRRFLDWLESSGIDRAVALALDPVYDRVGSLLPGASPLVVDNDYIADLAASHPRVLFGASIHPYRKDALAELERLLTRGACLVKWIPSTQQIRLDDPLCTPFFELLAARRVPLLVHTGHEHVSSRTRNSWNDPALLVHPLQRGVTVIAAHCGARLLLHEPCGFKMFCRMTREHERLYGDISAFGLPTRIGKLRALLRDPAVLSRIVYGSDFPVPIWPRSFLFALGAMAVREVLREPNPLRRPYLLMRRMGFPEEVFTRAGTLLRLDHPGIQRGAA